MGFLFLISFIILKIAFFKEDFIILLRNVFSLFWLFVLPGYFIMLFWKDKIGFLERFVIGIAISAGVTGIASYYLGLMGLNIEYHSILLPIVLILFGVAVNLKKIRTWIF